MGGERGKVEGSEEVEVRRGWEVHQFIAHQVILDTPLDKKMIILL